MVSKQSNIKMFNQAMRYPYDVSFEISGSNPNTVYAVREEISVKCGRFGKWIGAGCFNGMKKCDTQITYRSEEDVKSAQNMAYFIAKGTGVKLKVDVNHRKRGELLNMYKLTEDDVK
jgi:hypothetical protein